MSKVFENQTYLIVAEDHDGNDSYQQDKKFILHLHVYM